MPKYKVLVEGFELEGTPTPKGEMVTLDEAVAAPLIEKGSLSVAVTENSNVPEQPAQSPKFDDKKSAGVEVKKSQGVVSTEQSKVEKAPKGHPQRSDGSDASVRTPGHSGNPDPHVGDIVPQNDGIIPETMNTPTVKNEPFNKPAVTPPPTPPTDGKWPHSMSTK